MGLVLGVPLGTHIVVGDERFKVIEILGPAECILVDDEGIEYTITDDRAEEVRPEVFVSVGLGQTATTAKISFDAPRQVGIRREG